MTNNAIEVISVKEMYRFFKRHGCVEPKLPEKDWKYTSAYQYASDIERAGFVTVAISNDRQFGYDLMEGLLKTGRWRSSSAWTIRAIEGWTIFGFRKARDAVAFKLLID